MTYPFILKFSSITNLSDARYAAGMWADFIGFNFDPSSEHYIEPAQAASIKSWITGVTIVGEFGQQPVSWILDFASQLKLRIIQIPADYADLSIFENDLKTIVEVHTITPTAAIEKADVLLCHNMDVYDFLNKNYPQHIIYQSASLTEDASKFSGLAIQGVNENAPGTRNQSDWTDFLERYATDF